MYPTMDSKQCTSTVTTCQSKVQKYSVDPEPPLHDQLVQDSGKAVGPIPTRLPK